MSDWPRVTIVGPGGVGAYYGGIVAAPAAKKIIEESLTLLRVPEDAARVNE